jgi:hypothetical protein
VSRPRSVQNIWTKTADDVLTKINRKRISAFLRLILPRTWLAVLVIGCAGPVRRIRWPLRCDVLVDVEEVAGIVRPLDLDQAVMVLAVVVLDLVVIVVLHEVDVAAGL